MTSCCTLGSRFGAIPRGLLFVPERIVHRRYLEIRQHCAAALPGGDHRHARRGWNRCFQQSSATAWPAPSTIRIPNSLGRDSRTSPRPCSAASPRPSAIARPTTNIKNGGHTPVVTLSPRPDFACHHAAGRAVGGVHSHGGAGRHPDRRGLSHGRNSKHFRHFCCAHRNRTPACSSPAFFSRSLRTWSWPSWSA